jgi:hypothetical protein
VQSVDGVVGPSVTGHVHKRDLPRILILTLNLHTTNSLKNIEYFAMCLFSICDRSGHVQAKEVRTRFGPGSNFGSRFGPSRTLNLNLQVRVHATQPLNPNLKIRFRFEPGSEVRRTGPLPD